MKKTAFLPVALLLLAGLICCYPTRAQFFKNVLNSVKSTVQSKSNDKASTVTGQTFDKVTGAPNSNTKTATTAGTPAAGGTASGAGGGATDSASMMRALAMMTGGGGVSAADSAAAIKSFMTASGGSGYLFQYQITINSKKGNSKDTTTSWFTNSGNGRSEMRMNYPGVTSGKIITIAHATQRQYSVLLDPDDKTYSLNVIDTALINSAGGEDYKVTPGQEPRPSGVIPVSTFQSGIDHGFAYVQIHDQFR